MERKSVRRATFTIVGGLVAGLTTLAYWRYRRDLRAARARVSSGSQVVNTTCGPIEYSTGGTGPPLLVIHGAGGGFDQGMEFARPLIASGFRVIALSRFGYLRTPLPVDASPIAQADAHASLLDALDVHKVAVFGVSAGAPSAMQFCLRYPERCSAMILVVPMPFTPHAQGQPQERPSALTRLVINTTLRSDLFFWITKKLARGALVSTILATPLTDFRNAAAEEQERVLKVLQDILPISQRQKGLSNDAAIAASLPRYELERFTVPTLVVSSENDLYGTFKSGRYTAEHIPGARFIGYPTGGHLLVGHQEEVWSEITEFLNKL